MSLSSATSPELRLGQALGAGSPRVTHHHDVARSVLDGAEEPQDHDDDVQEVGEDRSPLVAQEVKHLPL